jgi:hypothetical protein
VTTLLIVDSPFRVGIELSRTSEISSRCEGDFLWTIIEEVPGPRDKAMPSGGAKEGSFLAKAV